MFKYLRDRFHKNIARESVAMSSFWLLIFASSAATLVATVIVVLSEILLPGYFLSIEPGRGQVSREWFPAIIFNPVFESIILGTSVMGAEKLGCGRYSALLAAALISGLHSLQSPFWGLTVFTFFFIQADAFLFLYGSRCKHAFMMIAISHALHNGWVMAIRNTWY